MNQNLIHKMFQNSIFGGIFFLCHKHFTYENPQYFNSHLSCLVTINWGQQNIWSHRTNYIQIKYKVMGLKKILYIIGQKLKVKYRWEWLSRSMWAKMDTSMFHTLIHVDLLFWKKKRKKENTCDLIILVVNKLIHLWRQDFEVILQINYGI